MLKQPKSAAFVLALAVGLGMAAFASNAIYAQATTVAQVDGQEDEQRASSRRFVGAVFATPLFWEI